MQARAEHVEDLLPMGPREAASRDRVSAAIRMLHAMYALFGHLHGCPSLIEIGYSAGFTGETGEIAAQGEWVPDFRLESGGVFFGMHVRRLSTLAHWWHFDALQLVCRLPAYAVRDRSEVWREDTMQCEGRIGGSERGQTIRDPRLRGEDRGRRHCRCGRYGLYLTLTHDRAR